MKKKWNDDLLIQAVKKVSSFNELFEFFQISNSNALRTRVKTLNLDTTHWFRAAQKPRANKLSLDQVLVEHSLYTCSSALKKKILKAGLLFNKCQECDLSTWRDKPISLQLDHINGIKNDNRIENLRILCPNCHSQTETYAGKNNKNTRRKCKELTRYLCPYCNRGTHNSQVIACQKCMVKNQIGIFKKIFSAKQEEEIKQKHSQGMSLNKLSKQYSVSRDTITKIVRGLYITSH